MGAVREGDVGPQQPEPDVDGADKGLHERVDDGQVVHGAGVLMVRRDAAEPGRGSKGRPSSAATAAIERAKTRQGTRLRAAVFSGFAYWPRGLLWRVGVAGADGLGGGVLRGGLRLHGAGRVGRIPAQLRGL